MDNDERTFEVTGVRNDNSSSLFEKVERGGHGGLRESYCQLCTIDEVIYGLSHGEIIVIGVFHAWDSLACFGLLSYKTINILHDSHCSCEWQPSFVG